MIRTRAFTLFAGALAAAALFASPALAIQNADDVPAGERMRRIVSIDTETLLPGGGTLLKGSPADVEIESLGKGKVKATFFQGGVRKGEAEGNIVLGSAPPPLPPPPASKAPGTGPAGRRGQGALRLSDLGFDANSPYAFVKGAGKVDLAIGNPGSNQILIPLPQPAVVAPPAVVPPAKTAPGTSSGKAPRPRDAQER